MSETYNWYSTLIKPMWAPPSWLFGPVWTFLYALIAISFAAVFYKVLKNEIPRKVAWPFVLNLIFNFAFTPLQFGLQNNLLAAVDVLLVWGTLVWAMSAVWKHMRWVTYLQIPYLLWVTFASILQLTITYLNL